MFYLMTRGRPKAGCSPSLHCLPGNPFDFALRRVPIMGTVWSDFFAGRNPLPPPVCVAVVQNENEAVLQKQKRTKALGCFKLVKFLKFLMVYQSDVIVKFWYW